MSNKKAWSSFKTGFCKKDKPVVNRETKKIEEAGEFWYYFGDGLRKGIKIYAGITIGTYALAVVIIYWILYVNGIGLL